MPAIAAGELKRVQILPVGELQELCGAKRLHLVARELRLRRARHDVVAAGDVFRDGGADFAVVTCEPAEGRLGTGTDYYLEGSPLVKFEKIEFSVWGAEEVPSKQLFSDYLAPHFEGECSVFGPSCRRTRILERGQTFKIGDLHFQVEATEPPGLGVVTDETDIYAMWDSSPEFEKVEIVPFRDTLPRAYKVDIFSEYVRPYLLANGQKRFAAGDIFCYHGIEFKLVDVEPNIVARIGGSTAIYSGSALRPSLRNLLPRDMLSQVAQLPVDVRMLMLNTERTPREVRGLRSRGRGLFDETLQQIHCFTWLPEDVTEQSCRICLGEFAIGDRCRRLPCGHVYHRKCIDEWLRRCTDCPFCRDNVDRAIRKY